MAEHPLPGSLVPRLLPTLQLAGAWQMAIDRWLLEQGRPAFRLYRWSRPTLSLGFHQHQLMPHWPSLARQGLIDLVRRPSGGRAVLHAGELTYALIWPNPGLARKEAYRRSCAWLQLAFARLGLPLQFGDQAVSLERSSCFATSTAADLVHPGGLKRIGSAQLWRQGCLLQHGSILIEPPMALWQEVFGAPPPALSPLPIDPGTLEHRLLDAAREALPMALGSSEPLLESEWEQIGGRLGDHHWEAGPSGLVSTSPLASMVRTTWGSPNPRG